MALEIEFSEAELRLMVKLVEANDSGMLDRRGRLGALRVRTSLTHKLYEAKDTFDGEVADFDDEEEEESDAQRQ